MGVFRLGGEFMGVFVSGVLGWILKKAACGRFLGSTRFWLFDLVFVAGDEGFPLFLFFYILFSFHLMFVSCFSCM